MAQSPISFEVAGDMVRIPPMNSEIRPRFGYGVIPSEATIGIDNH